MRNRLSKTLPLAVALLLAVGGAADAGVNAAATFAIDTDTEITGVGPGAQVAVTVSAAGLVNVKQLEVTFQVSPASAFVMSSSTFTLGGGFASALSPGVEFPQADQVKGGGAILIGSAVNGASVLGTLTLTTAADFTSNTQATITVFKVGVGPTSTTKDIFTATSVPALTVTPGAVVTVNPPAPAPTVTSIAPTSGPITGGTAVTITGTNFVAGATVSVGGAAATGVTVVSATSITATTPIGAEGAADVVVTNADAQAATLTGGFTYIGIIEPALTATTARDVTKDYSAVGEAAAIDGSAGEATFSVRFNSNTGAAATGQTINWAITNNGSESVYRLGAGAAAEIVSGATINVSTTTAAGGVASITLDAEGAKTAGTTSVSVTAATASTNSIGTARDLSVAFAATWDVPVAAELSSFAGGVTPGKGVLLQWTVASQSGNLGWQVYRSTDNVTFVQVGDLVAGEGTVDAMRSYEFVDNSAPVAGVLYYYLNQVDLDGSATRSQIIEVAIAPTAIVAEALPVSTALRQNYPNPFNPETTISFDLAEATVVTLTVYDATGQTIRTLVLGETYQAGRYTSVWDGRDNGGAKVASGVYLYQLQTGEQTALRRMTLVQ